MDNIKTGLLIAALRRESCLTQKELAAQLGVGDKAVSKWERGIGCPDVSLLPGLSHIFGVSVGDLLNGDLPQNDFVGGNMKKTIYYVCPECGNITICTGNADVSCCGRKLTAFIPKKPDTAHDLIVQVVEDEWFIESPHPMLKAHYISFIGFATGERLEIVKQYPEWNLQTRIAKHRHGMLLWYCTEHGLFYKNI